MMNLEEMKKRVFDGMRLEASKPTILIVGFGITGISIAHFLKKIGLDFSLIDSRKEPPNLSTIREMYDGYNINTGAFMPSKFMGVTHLFVSPGVSLREPCIEQCLASGAKLLSDIDLFAYCIDTPVIAITGSNGKSTVTTMVKEIAESAGRKVYAGGNLGVPALDLLKDDAELYVLELSSFQLERMTALKPQAAVVLNVSSDHLDRHSDIGSYAEVKRKIYERAQICVVNIDDSRVMDMVNSEQKKITFSIAKKADFRVQAEGGEQWLVNGDHLIINRDNVLLVGEHNTSNALAAMALVTTVGIPDEAIINGLMNYQGLPHRLQVVSTEHQIVWVNDSKATNPSSCIAALMAFNGKVILIAGGDSKGSDLTELAAIIKQQVRMVIVFGRDAERIKKNLHSSIPVVNSETLEGAVLVAKEVAVAGETVLLSPACASLDQFKDYQERGDRFAQMVRRLAA